MKCRHQPVSVLKILNYETQPCKKCGREIFLLPNDLLMLRWFASSTLTLSFVTVSRMIISILRGDMGGLEIDVAGIVLPQLCFWLYAKRSKKYEEFPKRPDQPK